MSTRNLLVYLSAGAVVCTAASRFLTQCKDRLITSGNANSDSKSRAEECLATTPMDKVRTSTAKVIKHMRSLESCKIQLNEDRIRDEIKNNAHLYDATNLPPSWAQDYHFCDGTDLTAQYVIVLSSLNHCFWPLEGYEYDQLASTLKRVLTNDKHAFDADRLMQLTPEMLNNWLKPKDAGDAFQAPNVEERCRLVQEVGRSLYLYFNGSFANMIRSANNSAARLVELITAYFPGFRDHAMYNGHQVFFYKRAQICVGDIMGAFQSKELGQFHDIDNLTCFADYRLPQLMRSLGIIEYSPDLAARIDGKVEIASGSEVETQIRACTVQAVELMRVELAKQGVDMKPVYLDWILWERGEALLNQLKPHHRAFTIYY